VDLTLRVVIRPAKGTLSAWKPGCPHGTTMRFGVYDHGIAIVFSQRVVDEYQKTTQGVDRNITDNI
jgi:hypothetical protein